MQIGPQLPKELQVDGDDDADDDEPVDRSVYHDPMADTRGWYEDGAYMARPDPEQIDYDEDEDPDDDYVTDKAVHEAYFTSLLNQYHHLRNTVRAQPPPRATLPPGTPTYAAAGDRDARSTTRLWSGVLRKSDPHPLQISRLSKDSVLRILRIILGGKFLRQGYPIEERTSRWLWALLARMPDRGELDYTEIGWIRDLGRRAVLLGRSLAEMAALREELEEGALGVHEGVDESSSDEEIFADHDVEFEDNASGCVPVTAPTSDVDVDSKSRSAGEAVDEQDETVIIESEGKPDIDSQGKGSVDDGQEEGEIEEDEDVAMDLASNSSEDEPQTVGLEDAKARLLERLAQDEQVDAKEAERDRSRMNMRATLNMILTVAGEFYGQRDLLEFREPFVGL